MTNEEFHDALYRERCRRETAENKNRRLLGEREVLAELLRDATAVLRTIDPEDATEGEQLEALIDRAEKAYGAILETPNA